MPYVVVRFGKTEIDVGAQGVQRHTAFAVPFHTGDVGTSQTTRYVDTDTKAAQAHCATLNGTFHGTAERHAALKLLDHTLRLRAGHRFQACGFQRCSERLRHSSLFSESCLTQFFDIGAFFADDNAWTSGVDGDANVFRSALDNNLADASRLEVCRVRICAASDPRSDLAA
jgi:hypothetical protein